MVTTTHTITITPMAMHRSGYKGRDVLGRLGFNPGLLQKSEIPEPVYESTLPGTERYARAVRQASRVAAVAIHVHLNVRYAQFEHRAEVGH